jgi:hypothetical protein
MMLSGSLIYARSAQSGSIRQRSERARAKTKRQDERRERKWRGRAKRRCGGRAEATWWKKKKSSVI